MAKQSSKDQLISVYIILTLLATACDRKAIHAPVPHEGRWGIYTLELATQRVELLYSTPNEISTLDLNPVGDRLTFSHKVNGDADQDSEIFSLGIEDRVLQRLTSNHFLDTYPVWSPDGSQIAYLAWPGSTLDIYIMAKDGSQSKLLYDSGGHDGDVDWVNHTIVFTRNNQIWTMNPEGTGAQQLSNPPQAGEWGNANLPFGDYDPRINPDGSKIIFERMVDDKWKVVYYHESSTPPVRMTG
jgi:Tol biopolymer transport system component